VTRLPNARAVVELVRLPAALSVPGDVLVGAAATGGLGGASARGRAAGMVVASTCLYLAGMALNDYADREVDARERPLRPIPSGRVPPTFALGLASALTAAGVLAAGLAGGRGGLAVSVPLAGTVWAYDLAIKRTPFGPAAMAAARSLDVLMGTAAVGTPARTERGPTTRIRSGVPKGTLGTSQEVAGLREALPAAGVVGAHTFMMTTISRYETVGASPGLGVAALAGTAGVTATAAWLAHLVRRGPRWRRATAAGLLTTYAGPLMSAELCATRAPTPANLQRLVATGVLGLVPLDAALLTPTAPASAIAGITAAWPLARRLARRVSPT
jgi:4-hydroxybenzoate polyprenyltransferase